MMCNRFKVLVFFDFVDDIESVDLFLEVFKGLDLIIRFF